MIAVMLLGEGNPQYFYTHFLVVENWFSRIFDQVVSVLFFSILMPIFIVKYTAMWERTGYEICTRYRRENAVLYENCWCALFFLYWCICNNVLLSIVWLVVSISIGVGVEFSLIVCRVSCSFTSFVSLFLYNFRVKLNFSNWIFKFGVIFIIFNASLITSLFQSCSFYNILVLLYRFSFVGCSLWWYL